MIETTLNARNTTLLAKLGENGARTFTINYAPEFAFSSPGDTISTSTWSAEGSGATISSESNTTLTTSARLSGDIGHHRIVNKIVTTNGDTIERFIDLYIRRNDEYLGYWRCYR